MTSTVALPEIRIEHATPLERLHRAGFLPRTIIDIGAHRGGWTRAAHMVWPGSSIHAIEADSAHETHLRQALEGIPSHVDIALVADGNKPLPFYRVLEGTSSGSSIYPEMTGFQTLKHLLPVHRLDSLVPFLDPPVLLKADVQGAELDVLRGGLRTLYSTEVVLLELALLPYNQGAPLFAEVIAFMASKDFVVYDFGEQFRRSWDGALFHVDVVFTRRDSSLRDSGRFW